MSLASMSERVSFDQDMALCRVGQNISYLLARSATGPGHRVRSDVVMRNCKQAKSLACLPRRRVISYRDVQYNAEQETDSERGGSSSAYGRLDGS